MKAISVILMILTYAVSVCTMPSGTSGELEKRKILTDSPEPAVSSGTTSDDIQVADPCKAGNKLASLIVN